MKFEIKKNSTNFSISEFCGGIDAMSKMTR
jgi:hypothetical protein